MISLKIQNLILIEHAEISFEHGLNIITGETGSGKSVLLTAVRLIKGARAETGLIREGKEFAIIEALFENGVHIRREFYRSGKNRCFIDESQVSLSALKEAVDIEMVDQNSSGDLFAQQKDMLDTYGNLTEFRKKIENSLEEERRLKEEKQKLEQIAVDRELEWAKEDLEMIDGIDFNEDDLNIEHNLLSHAVQISEKTNTVIKILEQALSIKKAQIVLEQIAHLDPKLKPLSESIKSVYLELEESSQFLESYLGTIEANPLHLDEVERKLAQLEKAKRRFGPNLNEAKEKLIKSIEHLNSVGEKLELTTKQLSKIAQANQELQNELTEKRKQAALPFSKKILEELKTLNLHGAQFEIEVQNQWNQVNFLFSANAGQSLTPISNCASGGELSRLLLTIKTLLSGGKSTLVFDEIDSNVGGHTALMLGQKLKTLAAHKQVICVTHFVQVAKCASAHFLVKKSSHGPETFSNLMKLNEKEKEIEYHRMLGET